MAKERETLQVGDIVSKHASRQVPTVHCDTPVEDLSRAIEWFRHSHQLYVVDEDNRLLGNITLRSLADHVFHHRHGAAIHPRHLLKVITTETARDLMAEETVSATMEEPVEKVLERMIARHVEEVPVVDDDGRVIGDMTMIDLLRIL